MRIGVRSGTLFIDRPDVSWAMVFTIVYKLPKLQYGAFFEVEYSSEPAVNDCVEDGDPGRVGTFGFLRQGVAGRQNDVNADSTFGGVAVVFKLQSVGLVMDVWHGRGGFVGQSERG